MKTIPVTVWTGCMTEVLLRSGCRLFMNWGSETDMRKAAVKVDVHPNEQCHRQMCLKNVNTITFNRLNNAYKHPLKNEERIHWNNIPDRAVPEIQRSHWNECPTTSPSNPRRQKRRDSVLSRTQHTELHCRDYQWLFLQRKKEQCPITFSSHKFSTLVLQLSQYTLCSLATADEIFELQLICKKSGRNLPEFTFCQLGKHFFTGVPNGQLSSGVDLALPWWLGKLSHNAHSTNLCTRLLSNPKYEPNKHRISTGATERQNTSAVDSPVLVLKLYSFKILSKPPLTTCTASYKAIHRWHWQYRTQLKTARQKKFVLFLMQMEHSDNKEQHIHCMQNGP